MKQLFSVISTRNGDGHDATSKPSAAGEAVVAPIRDAAEVPAPAPAQREATVSRLARDAAQPASLPQSR
jgi:hypothetical protein